MLRPDGRQPQILRPVKIQRNYIDRAKGSVLIQQGKTRVLCVASVENQVPPHLKNTNTGWITAEYGMLPGATGERIRRERSQISGRTYEIQRMIGRSLRAVVELPLLGERTITLDCDVIQADGGTRTAAITGSFVALRDALYFLKRNREIPEVPIKNFLAAVSVGIVKGVPLLDLCYEEDSKASVDMNVVMTDEGKFVELQSTGEEATFSSAQLNELLELAKKGINQLIGIQKEILLGKKA